MMWTENGLVGGKSAKRNLAHTGHAVFTTYPVFRALCAFLQVAFLLDYPKIIGSVAPALENGQTWSMCAFPGRTFRLSNLSI